LLPSEPHLKTVRFPRENVVNSTCGSALRSVNEILRLLPRRSAAVISAQLKIILRQRRFHLFAQANSSGSPPLNERQFRACLRNRPAGYDFVLS
jgi:hypothetical protein